MRKISVLLIGLVALFATGCAEESTTITSDDIPVSSFYNMGCNDNFDYTIELGKNPSVSGTFPNAITYDLSCNSDTYVTIEFYDNGWDGHYRYFLVNGENPSYADTIYRGGTGTYIFQYNNNMPYERGTYYGLARVTAINLETREYYTHDYDIRAYENSINSKEEIAVSKFEARKAPELPAKSEEAKAEEVKADNATAEEAK